MKKKQLSKLIFAAGLEPAYSGREKTMFIHYKGEQQRVNAENFIKQMKISTDIKMSIGNIY